MPPPVPPGGAQVGCVAGLGANRLMEFVFLAWYGVTCFLGGWAFSRYVIPWIVDHYPLIRRDR